MPFPAPHRGRIAIGLLIVGAVAGVWAEDLATGQLAIRGAVLRVSPEHQEVAPGLPTVVHTSLGQLEPGQIPAGLRVEGDLSGPGLDEPLELTTTPGDAFRIPGLNREGTYTLSGIRLVEGDRMISSADPDTVEILVHRLVISSITSRALTPEEMDAYGIVIDADNYTAWHYTVGFQIEGGTVEVPFDLLLGPQGMTLLDSPDAYALPVPNPDLPELPVPSVTTGELNPIPPAGMPDLDEEDMAVLAAAPIPGFIVIPTDIAFLNQFFSVIMVVQNGALAGSGLELRGLTGVLELTGDGLRQAETEPPTIPGEPVPVLDPGPDGEPGTSDDLMFIVAQASGQATWLVEGLEEGQHRLTAHLTGEIHGLASGNPAMVEGRIPGVVVVRDPRFALTFFHPNTVRSGEFYDFRVSVTNTSTTPVYDLSMELPINAISGARLAESQEVGVEYLTDPVQHVAELLPGTTAMVTWTLESRRTGRVVASAFNTSSPIDASFVFEIGVGELGIPLSPESIVLPPTVDDLPQAVVEPALELLGLAHSVANAPNGVEVDLPPVGETIVMLRGTELAAAGQRHAFGEPVDRSVVGLGLDWMGVTHWSSSFDVLRRQSRRGHELENATAFHLGQRMEDIGADEALAEVEKLAISGRPMVLVFAEGAGFGNGARLSVVGSTSERTAIGQRADVELFSRELEGTSILSVDTGFWSGEVGVVAVPLDGMGGWTEENYEIQLSGVAPGSVDLEVVLVMPDGGTRRFAPSAVIETANGGLASLAVGPEMADTTIYSDSNGDAIQDWSEEIEVIEQDAPSASIITTGFTQMVNSVRGGSYRNIVLLLSRPVDEDALESVEAADWFVESTLEIAEAEGDSESFARERHGRSFRLQLDPRILVVTLEEPLNPHAELRLSSGLSPLPLVGGGTLAIVDQPISVGEGLESGVVRGVVLGPDGGPLAHASLELYELIEICSPLDGCNWYPSFADRVGADAAGGFLFDAVRYRDETIPSRQAAFTVRAVDPATGHEARLVAQLPGDNEIQYLTLAMVGRGDVIGTLRNADESPLDQPDVIARSITNPSEGAQAVPDASGNFRLEDLPVGPVQVVARDGQAYTYATTQITAPGAEAVVDLVLQTFSQPLAQVEGSVIDSETAEPVPGLGVYVIPAGFSGATHVATTDDEGAFSMSAVPPGIARFRAWSPVQGRYVGEVFSDLLGDATTTVEMVIRPDASGTIVGTVKLAAIGSEAPVKGAYVVARDQGVFTLTDDEGRYELANLPLGRIRLETWDPVTSASTSRDVDLTADGQVLVIDFVLREDLGFGSVTVNVADRNGVPEVGAEVAIGRFGSSRSGLTGADGSVRIEDVAPGSHEVLVRVGGRLARGNATVASAGHHVLTDITLGGQVGATIRVVADTTGDGSSVPMTPISYRVPGVTSAGRIGQLPEDGWTQCELEEDHSCRVENLPTDVGSLVAMATSGFYGPVTASLWIDERDDHELIINFEAPGTVGGRVVQLGSGGLLPVEGATVELWTRTVSGLVPQSKFTTGGDGTFSFDLVPLGSYSIRAHHESFGIQWIDGTVGAGQVIDDLELVLRGRASIEGEVALCFDKALEKAGSQVRVTLRPHAVPRPFISGPDIDIDDFKDGVLDVTLGEDDRASFVFADRMVGGWTLTATSALNGSAYEPVSLGPSGGVTTLTEPVCLHPTGTVSGLVSFPEDGDPAPSATVQLFRKVSYYFEYLTTETTSQDGSYIFSDTPVGYEYQVRAFDAASNRGGVSASAVICDASDPNFGSTCGRDAELDVSLSPMGRLTGVLADENDLPVANAHIRLWTSVILNQGGLVQSHERDWVTFTGADGGFSFDGVPAGTALVTAFDSTSPLFVEKAVSIDPVSSPVTSTNLQLPPTADVAVTVVDPLGAEVDGETVVVFHQSSPVYFRESSGSVPLVEHLTFEIPASFAGAVADRYLIGACFGDCSSAGVDQILSHQFNTALGAVAERWMSNPPSDQVAELELVGRADVAVTVTQGGVPVADAAVRITGTSFYGTRDVPTQTGADGAIIPIAGLGTGSYTVTALSQGLGGSQEIEITQLDHGATIEVEVQIEDSGSADGRVFDPAGNPSVGALINMISGGRTFQAVSGEDGSFAFAALAANQTYRLEAYAADGLGRHTLHEIVVGTGLVPIGDLVLDEVNPWVASTAPANGAQDADANTDIVVDFSELMRPETLSGNRISVLEQGAGTAVPTTPTIEDLPDPDGEGPLAAFTRVTLSHGPLKSEQLYLVTVLNGAEDLAGRGTAFDFHSTFRTRDTVPPQVLSISPSDDADGLTPVGPDAVPIVSCSESMAPESVNPSTVQLLDDGNQPVEAVVDVQREGFDIRIRPTTALELDSFYSIAIDGVTDAAGLPLTSPFISTFRVRDVQPPVVTLLPPDGVSVDGDIWTGLEGRPLILRAAVASNDALKSVVVSFGGVPSAAILDASGEYRLDVIAPTGVPDVTVSVQAEDVSGNLSAIVSHLVVLVDDQPPTGALSVDHTDSIYPNHLLGITVMADDDHGLRTAHVIVSGAASGEWTFDLDGIGDNASTTLRVPDDAAAGAQITISCELEDNFGQRTPLVPGTVSVRADAVAPVVSVVAPADGEIFSAGDIVEFVVDLEDDVGTNTVALDIGGEAVPVTLSSVVLPPESWTARATAVWQVPESDEVTDLTWTFAANDPAGNSGAASGSITVMPLGGEGSPEVSFSCPRAGDGFVPDMTMTLNFEIADDDQIQHYSMWIDGEEVVTEDEINANHLAGEYDWISPADAEPGDSITLRITARDYAGKTGVAQIALVCLGGRILRGSQEIASDHAGEDLVLAGGEIRTTSVLRPASLTLIKGSTLTAYDLDAIDILTDGQVAIACGASIDLTGVGYWAGNTYPGANLPDGNNSAGSHLGEGGISTGTPGETFGSVYRPRENGAGGIGNGSGGGVVHIDAGLVLIDGMVRANGDRWDQWRSAGAGGSVWIKAGSVTGGGSIQAVGGFADHSGGGGAITLDYESIDSRILDGLRAETGSIGSRGGAGTVYLFGPDAAHGDLVVDNAGLDGGWTVLPALGAGSALAGSGNSLLVTDRAREVPLFFVGHWVQIAGPDGEDKGIWRVDAVDGLAVTLEAGAEVAEGDSWQGVYRFDSVAVRGGARVRIDDLDDFGQVTVDPDSTLVLFNLEPPAVDPELIEFSVDQQGHTVLTGGLEACSDPDQPVNIEVINTTTGDSWQTDADADGSFVLVVAGSCGDGFSLHATDTHHNPRESTLDLGLLPDLVPPAVDEERTVTGIHDRTFWISGRSDSITEDCSLDRAFLVDLAQPGVQVPVTVAGDGSFTETAVAAPSGTVLGLTAVDGAGNESTENLDPLPANDGPPEIYSAYISRATSGGAYELQTNGECILFKTKPVGCNYPIIGFDEIEIAYVENRTTPGFGPYPLVVTQAACGNCNGGGYQFNPVTVAGAVGDEIWMVVEDGHPEWQTGEALVWTLPVIPSAPAVGLDSGDLVYYGGGYHLMAASSVITDPDGPLAVDVTTWRETAGVWSVVFTDTRLVASGEAFDVEIVGGTEGDLAVVAVTDATGLATTVRVGVLPAPQAITAAFDQAGSSVVESSGEVLLAVSLSEPPTTTVTVGYRTIAGSAEDDIDYQHTDETLIFGPGTTQRYLEVQIIDDGDQEAEETFQIELYAPVGVDLGTPATTEVSIGDNDGGVITVAYSVRVGVDNMLPAPIGVDISDGVATFATDLPEGPDRGDRVVLDILEPVFIEGCEDDRTCTVTDAVGLPPADVTGDFAISIEPAFGYLYQALEDAGWDYLGTVDLVAANRSLEIVCYGGVPDTEYVSLYDWVTSPENRIRIVAPTAAGLRGPSQRHSGRWSDQAYRLEVDGDSCMFIEVGNVTVEGLQLYCSGYPEYPLFGISISVDDSLGDVEITETLIRLDGAAATGDRVGIVATAGGPVEVVVRNSMLWDLGDGSSDNHVGIRVEDSNVSLFAANNTILGGAHGIVSQVDTTTVVNNLVLDSTDWSFFGEFSVDSTSNLSSDGEAPDPPDNDQGPLTVVNRGTGAAVDLHLGCGVMDQDVTITHDFGTEDMQRVFDDNPRTLVVSPAVNPARVRLEFDEEQTITGTAIEVSHSSSHDWMVAAADTVADLETQTGSYRELVPWRRAEHPDRVWDGVTFEDLEFAYVFELTVQRYGGDDYVHLDEWWLDGLNAACGAGADLSDEPDHAFSIDADSVARTREWDIGADQSRGLKVGFSPPPSSDRWEAEGHARLQVTLTEPATIEVSVRYHTENHDAIAGDDYVHTEGVLTFAPGEVSKTISVPLIDDGVADDREWLRVRLTDAAGARLGDEYGWALLRDGDAPVRIRLTETLIDVPESDGEVLVGVELSRVHTEDVTVWWHSYDGSAYIGSDFSNPNSFAVIPAGQTQTEVWFGLIDDFQPEPSEFFTIEGRDPSNAQVGVPSIGFIRIVDEDLTKGTP